MPAARDHLSAFDRTFRAANRLSRQLLRCEFRRQDPGIAELMRFNPDEERHHQAGCALLAKLATTPEAQERARSAAAQLLEIGDCARDTLLQKTGAGCIPGC
jgi:hypothetical protein